MIYSEYCEAICAMCIAIMKNVEIYTNISYGTINVILFIILGPLSTITFALATIASNIKFKYKNVVVILLSIIGILCILPIFYLTLVSAMSIP